MGRDSWSTPVTLDLPVSVVWSCPVLHNGLELDCRDPATMHLYFLALF